LARSWKELAVNKHEALERYPEEQHFYGEDLNRRRIAQLLEQYPTIAALREHWEETRALTWPSTYGSSPWGFAGSIASWITEHASPIHALTCKMEREKAQQDASRFSTRDIDEVELAALNALAAREPQCGWRVDATMGELPIDATAWFEEASNDAIVRLADLGWRGDDAPDHLGLAIEGQAVHMDPAHACAWIMVHRPAIMPRVEEALRGRYPAEDAGRPDHERVVAFSEQHRTFRELARFHADVRCLPCAADPARSPWPMALSVAATIATHRYPLSAMERRVDAGNQAVAAPGAPAADPDLDRLILSGIRVLAASDGHVGAALREPPVGSPEAGAIRAVAWDDHHVYEVDFDAQRWFTQASDNEILALAAAGWGRAEAADRVALFFEAEPPVSDVFTFVHAMNGRRDAPGFECDVDDEDAMDWLDVHRPELARKVRDGAEAHLAHAAPGDAEPAKLAGGPRA
jgi:hypothetical protein